jgi:hypothetical protein
MSQFLKYLGDSLRRTFGTVVERPIPWNMIDKLASLEEKCERIEGLDEGDRRAGQKPGHFGHGSSPTSRSRDNNNST